MKKFELSGTSPDPISELFIDPLQYQHALQLVHCQAGTQEFSESWRTYALTVLVSAGIRRPKAELLNGLFNGGIKSATADLAEWTWPPRIEPMYCDKDGWTEYLVTRVFSQLVDKKKRRIDRRDYRGLVQAIDAGDIVYRS